MIIIIPSQSSMIVWYDSGPRILLVTKRLNVTVTGAIPMMQVDIIVCHLCHINNVITIQCHTLNGCIWVERLNEIMVNISKRLLAGCFLPFTLPHCHLALPFMLLAQGLVLVPSLVTVVTVSQLVRKVHYVQRVTLPGNTWPFSQA